ncbi:MAG: type II toxin-antitoxin system VapC family toxin [Kiritimatiellae bacterium]|nr:type II toxin-antitoxin system VapC family toxin [Kiritimatiellia bacterium]
MILCDVNVLVYAHRPDSIPNHADYATWLTKVATQPVHFALSEAVLSAFIRVVTNPRIFREPTPTKTAIAFCNRLVERSTAQLLRPGFRNWEIFTELCATYSIQGKKVADIWHAALAIEYDCEWISTDRDFQIFRELKWRHPFP